LDIDGHRRHGTTDGNGKAEVFIPPTAQRGTITFRGEKDEDGEEDVEEFELHLGHLDPASEVSGIQGRLLNLGLYDGPLDGEMNPKLEEAIRVFQGRNGLEPTGKLDDSVKSWAERAHGS
jgi:type VI secretion system secreted protein VgrG